MDFDPNYDLTLLKDNFISCGTYTKDVILEELQYWQMHSDFFCVVHEGAFLIGYRNRDSLWIAQAYSKGSLRISRMAFDFAKEWARDNGMTSITFETKRDEMRALKRYGCEEFSVIMRCDL